MSEDLKVKIGTPEEVFWTELRDRIEKDTLQMERQIVMNHCLVGLAMEKIAEEKKKIK